MHDRILHAHLMIHFGKALAGLAAIFIPVQLTLNNYANSHMTLWTVAFVILTLAWGSLGAISNVLGDTLLWKLAHNLPETAKADRPVGDVASRTRS
ncbi:hypothetical protein ACTJJ7_11495 [Phyllobacterium sp. 22229]|uniref:Uncharacterized protein n=1 Tax=Agrobacterium radiobacter TaxID=362 RepID=A0ABD5LQB7_AGRRD